MQEIINAHNLHTNIYKWKIGLLQNEIDDYARQEEHWEKTIALIEQQNKYKDYVELLIGVKEVLIDNEWEW